MFFCFASWCILYTTYVLGCTFCLTLLIYYYFLQKKKNIDLIFWIRNHTYILSDKDDNLYKRKKDEKSLK